MARRSKPAEPPEDFVTPDDIDLETFLDEIGPSASIVEIFEMKRDGSRPHLDRVTMDTIREDVFGYLRQLNGPGKYLLLFKGANRAIQKSKVVEVGRGAPAVQPIAQPAPILPAVNPGVDVQVQLLREQIAQQNRVIETMISNQKGPDVGALLTGISNLIPKAPAENPMMTTVVTALLKNIGGGDVTTQAHKLLELARDLNGGSEKDDSFTGVLRDAAPAIVGALVGKQQQPNGNGNGAHNPAAPARNVTPRPAGAAAVPDAVRAGLDYIKPKIMANMMPVDLAFDIVRFQADKPEYAPIIRKAIDEGIDGVISLDPDIAADPYRAWFTELVRMIQEAHAAEQSDDDADAGAGNAGGTPAA